MRHALPEEKETLWLLAAAPSVWVAHFLLCYLTAAIWCAKFAGREGTLAPVRVAIAVYTLFALAVIAWVGVVGHRRRQRAEKGSTHDDDTPEHRHAFLGFMALLLAMLSAMAVVYEALPALVLQTCR